jgi:phosphoesterase RecJ-like protein
MSKGNFLRSKAQEFYRLLNQAKTIGIAGHVHPDGDCLGAMLSLKNFIEKQGKQVKVLAEKEDLPESYVFLPGYDSITDEIPGFNFDIFISVDAPNLKRLGRFKWAFTGAQETINIDHHPDNENFAQLNIVHKDFSSTSEIIFWILKHSGMEIDLETATCLYVGIVTDTGKFQYSNTFPSTFEAAKQLVERGVVPVEIFRKVYENIKPEVLKFLGVVLERVKSEDGFFWSYFTKQDLEKFKVKVSDTENFVDYIRSIRGVKVAALFKSIVDEQQWKVSLRSSGEINVQRLSAKFGGGGHYEAAGCEVSGTLDVAVRSILEVYRELTKEAEVS